MCESEPKREWSGWGLTSPSTHRTRVLPVIHLHRYEESDQKKQEKMHKKQTYQKNKLDPIES